jgi:Protein of unknown function (DUF4233)
MRSMASIVLGFESIVLALASIVMISIADVDPGTALPLCLGLAALALVAAGLLRSQVGYVLGWIIQVAAIGLGFVVPVMFVLGLVFGAFWVMAMVLGKRVDEAKKAHEAQAG